MQNESISLYYKEGSSDKVYQAELLARDGGFIVNFAFGRRGNTLQTGTKTSLPLEYAKAKKIYDKLISEKTAKGYTPGESGTPYTSTTHEERSTGIFPQLLNPISEGDAEQYMSDDAFWMQEKFDGKRILVQKDSDGRVRGINRRGLQVELPETVQKAALALKESILLDGEALGDRYVVFDCLEFAGESLREQPYKQRYARIPAFEKASAIQKVASGTTQAEKRKQYQQIQKRGGEGVVFKRHDAVYLAGRPAKGGTQLKCKFYATASVVVTSVKSGKRSVAMEVYDGGKAVGVGNVTIPPNAEIPEPKSVIEVRYLYAYKGGALFQPTFIHERDDVPAEDCVIGQLKYKAEDADTDEGVAE